MVFSPSPHDVERGLAGLVEAFRRLARGSERGWIEEHDHVISMVTGLPLPNFNPTFVVDAPRDPAGAFERVRAFYGARGAVGEINAFGDTAEAIAGAAATAGHIAGHRIPCMLLAPTGAPRPAAADLRMERVTTIAALRQFNDICADVFGMDRQSIAVMDEPGVLATPGLALHLGFVDGVPVATAMNCCVDRVAAIFSVATIASHRRRGIGEAMTWQAIDHGLEEGCDLAFLQASRQGRPVYERMGFRHFVDAQTWRLS